MVRLLTRTGQFDAAEAEIKQAVVLSEASAAVSASNMKAKANLAAAYHAAGVLRSSLARSNAGKSVSASQWRQARAYFKKSADVLQEMKTEKRLPIVQVSKLAESVHELAVCDSALATAASEQTRRM